MNLFLGLDRGAERRLPLREWRFWLADLCRGRITAVKVLFPGWSLKNVRRVRNEISKKYDLK